MIDYGEFVDGELRTLGGEDPRADNCVVYVTGFIDAGYVKEGDATLGKPGKITRLETPAGGVVLCGDSWGFRGRHPETLRGHMESVYRGLAGAGLKVRETAASVVGGLIVEHCDPGPLPPRWRGMAHAAIHSGPMIHAGAGAMVGAYIDLRKAYLAAMMEERVPVGNWYLQRSKKLGGKYIADVELMVPERHIPELPVKLVDGRNAFLHGHIRGCYPDTMLERAIKNGCEAVRVIRVIRNTRWETRLKGLSERLLNMPDVIRKPLYTRVWGKMSGSGNWSVSTDPREGYFPMGPLWWRRDENRIDRDFAPPFYRPDWAAYITANVQNRVMNAVRSMREGSVIATHTDAIWTDDVAIAVRLCSDSNKPGTWELEDVGRIRYFAQGRYIVKGKGVKMGMNGLEHKEYKSVAEFEADCERASDPTSPTRAWLGNPGVDANATSVPASLPTLDGCCRPAGFNVEDMSVWNERGYLSEAAKAWEGFRDGYEDKWGRRESSYVPRAGDADSEKARKAHKCGLELPPRHPWTRWLDRHENAEYVDLYHSGQMERYEQALMSLGLA